MDVKKLLVLNLTAICLASCGGTVETNEKIPSTDNVLVVDLHTMMPSGSSSSADLVSITVTQDIADEFYKLTGIKIKWFTGKTLDGETEEVSADYIKAIQNGTMPAIGFSWSAFADRGYYLDLEEYLNTPNEFLNDGDKEIYKTWKDQFPEYLWSMPDCSDASGKIISVPITLNPGPATGWFYNSSSFEAQGYDKPVTWNEFKKIAQDISVYPYKQVAGLNNWEVKFSIGPAFAKALSGVLDTDSDGKVSEMETLDGVINKKFSPVQSENPDYYQLAQGVYQIAKDYYKNVLPDNWKTATTDPLWSNGSIIKQNGIWALRAEDGNDATRSWKYGVFPAPLVSKDSAAFLKAKGLDKAANSIEEVKTIQLDQSATYSKAQRAEEFIKMYQPTPSLYPNLMKNGIYNNKKVLDNAVKFLKFLSTPENVSQMCIDHQGVLGGVYGSIPGDSLTNWLMQSFPVIPNNNWPAGYTVANTVVMNQEFNKWIVGTITDDVFYAKVSEEQIRGATAYKNSLVK